MVAARNVIADDDTLDSAVACLVAASLSANAITKLLGCSRAQAEHLHEGARADLGRVCFLIASAT